MYDFQQGRLWDIREAASYLRVSVAFLRKAVRERAVPFGRARSKAIRFRRSDLDDAGQNQPVEPK